MRDADLTIDRALRERIRRNIGNPRSPVLHPPPPPNVSRYGTIFDGGELTGAVPPPGEDGAGIILPPNPTIPEGTIIGVALSITNGTRRVGVTQSLPAPCMIRALTINGNAAIGTAWSFRVLLATDDDTTAVADPTGNDLIEYAGDLMVAEDAGVHANLSAQSLVVEPWHKVLSGGHRIKLKVHNASGGTIAVAVYVDLDALV